LSKYGFQPTLITILYIPRVESPAQPKYTPDVYSDTTSEKFSAGKLATVQNKTISAPVEKLSVVVSKKQI